MRLAAQLCYIHVSSLDPRQTSVMHVCMIDLRICGRAVQSPRVDTYSIPRSCLQAEHEAPHHRWIGYLTKRARLKGDSTWVHVPLEPPSQII